MIIWILVAKKRNVHSRELNPRYLTKQTLKQVGLTPITRWPHSTIVANSYCIFNDFMSLHWHCQPLTQLVGSVVRQGKWWPTFLENMMWRPCQLHNIEQAFCCCTKWSP